MMRVSAGTAAVLGLNEIKLAAAPTTAYLMTGEGCAYDCAFCTQARSASAQRGALSRVIWPEYEVDNVAERLAHAAETGELERVCLQVVQGQGWRDDVAGLVKAVRGRGLPVSVSVHLARPEDVVELSAMGVDRVSIPIDAATPELYAQIKGRPWEPTWRALVKAAELLPGRVGTHLIVGLGETEAEMVRLMSELQKHDVNIGLFAFTPVRGTRMAAGSPPPMPVYRRIQTAHYLIRRGVVTAADMTFAADGTIVDFGIAPATLRAFLSGEPVSVRDRAFAPDEPGAAFRTSGCDGCNRPYYNERPGSEEYNYPAALSPRQLSRCLAELGLTPAVASEAGGDGE
ncbi:MAG: radical SAM protein [Chloroflexota bacterium]